MLELAHRTGEGYGGHRRIPIRTLGGNSDGSAAVYTSWYMHSARRHSGEEMQLLAFKTNNQIRLETPFVRIEFGTCRPAGPGSLDRATTLCGASNE